MTFQVYSKSGEPQPKIYETWIDAHNALHEYEQGSVIDFSQETQETTRAKWAADDAAYLTQARRNYDNDHLEPEERY